MERKVAAGLVAHEDWMYRVVAVLSCGGMVLRTDRRRDHLRNSLVLSSWMKLCADD